jgi:hypothetical protein
MEMQFKPSEREILTDIHAIEKKLDYLKNLQSLKEIKEVKIYFKSKTFDHRGVFIDIDQSNIPFNLGTEIMNLITDSIDQYERTRNTLFSMLKSNNNG